MAILITIGVLLAITGIGAYITLKNYSTLIDEQKFVVEYTNNFRKFANNFLNPNEKKFNDSDYEWLTKNAGKIQGIVGWCGIMDYIAPFGKFHAPNYQIIVNTIPKFRDGSVQRLEVQWVDDALIRFYGEIEELIKKKRKKLFNPIVWFSVGIQQILSIPVLILSWLGIFSSRSASRITHSKPYTVISGLVSLVALFSGIVTIIVGWDKFSAFLFSVFGR